MEMFGPGMGAFGHEAGTVTFWGDGTRPIEVTGVEDTARMARGSHWTGPSGTASPPSPATASPSWARPR